MTFIDYYKQALRDEINKLKTLTVFKGRAQPEQEVTLAEVSINNHGYLNALSFLIGGNFNIKVGIQMQNIRRMDGEVKIKFSLPLMDGNFGCANATTILDRSGDLSGIKWKAGRSIFKWATRQNAFVIEDHKNFWYGNAGKLELAEEYGQFIIENFGDTLSVSLANEDQSEKDDHYQPTAAVIEIPQDQDTVTPYAEEAELMPPEITEIANFHAHAIVLKAFDLALYNFRTTKNEFLSWRGNDKISSSALNAFPLINAQNAIINTQVPILSPGKLKEKCLFAGLHFSDELYQTVCVAINSGRHIIFTGPPGCGKSQLAEQVGTLATEIFYGKKGADASPKFVTASPSWTSGEVIGRYFPSRNQNSPLEFHPGIFLEAVKHKRCLVIDEINRANMDECFGELFTVLAGQACDLVYQDAIADSRDEDGKLTYGPIKIVPYQLEDLSEIPGYCIYSMGDGFRLIGTMNTFDRSALHQMSFALMRRFDVIPVSAPSKDQILTIINNKLSSLIGDNNEKLPAWGNVVHNRARIKTQIENLTLKLFSSDQGFVTRGVVGVSMVGDFLDFIVRLLNPALTSNPCNLVIEGAGIGNAENAARCIVKSAAVLALVVKLIPQLAGAEDKIGDVINCVKDAMAMGNNDPRVNFSYSDGGGLTIQPAQSLCFDLFQTELLSAYKNTPLAKDVRIALNLEADA